MPKIDPVPWNVYVRTANDLDVDKMIESINQRLGALMPGTIEQFQKLLKGLGVRGRDEPSVLESLASNGVAILTLVARLELLERLKDHMTPRPPVVISEAEAIRIADARWKEPDREYDYWDFSRAITALREQKLVRLHRMPKTEGCRYTFIKPSAQYPNAYRVFRQIAWFCEVDLGLQGRTFVGLWSKMEPKAGRLVVTADVAKSKRRAPEAEPPLDPPTASSSRCSS